MMNKEQGLTDSLSCPTIEIPGRPTTNWILEAKEKHQLNPGGPTAVFLRR